MSQASVVSIPQTRWNEIIEIWKTYAIEYRLFLVGGIIAFGVWIFGSNAFQFAGDMLAYLTNVFTESLSIIVTVLVLDRLNERRADNRLKEELLADLHSPSNNMVLNALQRLRDKNWLPKDYFVNINLQNADWSNAYIGNMNFEGARLRGISFNNTTNNEMDANFPPILNNTDLRFASLKNAELIGASIKRADLKFSHLESANLMMAHLEGSDLKGAHLYGTNLFGANLEGADLTSAKLNEKTSFFGAVLPDSTKWSKTEEMTRFTDKNHADYEATKVKIDKLKEKYNLIFPTRRPYI